MDHHQMTLIGLWDHNIGSYAKKKKNNNPTTVTVTAARTVFIKRRGQVRYFITRKHEREEGSRISCLRSAARLVA